MGHSQQASSPRSSSYKIGCVVEDIAISRLDLYTAENGLHFQAPAQPTELSSSSSLSLLSYMLFLPWRRAVYIFDRYGVINNGFLCCFRGLAFFQLAFPLRLCRRSFSCGSRHAILPTPAPYAGAAVPASLLLFAFFARVSFSFFPCFSARKFPLLSYEAPKS